MTTKPAQKNKTATSKNSKDAPKAPPEDKHYASLLGHLNDWISKGYQDKSLPLSELFEKAGGYVQAAGDMTREEWHKLEDYLKRDMAHLSDELEQDAQSSYWWQSTKVKLWQLLGELSDKNKLEQLEMLDDIEHRGLYQAGEMVAIGELVCERCRARYPVYFAQKINPCVECGHKVFIRHGHKAGD